MGGVEIYTKNLADALNREGHSVSIITSLSHPDLPPQENLDGVSVHRLPFFEALSSRNIEKIAEVRANVAAIKARTKPDIVQVNFTDASPFFHLTTRREGERSILVCHSPLDDLSEGISLTRQLSRECSSCIAISEFMAAHLSQRLPDAAQKLEIIRNGADDKLFASSLRESPKANEFVFVGRFVEEKGADIILQAMSLLKREGKTISLKLIGAGPHRSALDAAVERFVLADQVEFVGRLAQTDLAKSIRHAAAVIMPSLFREPAPLVAVEVSMAGVPIIGSRIGGIPDVVEDGKTGLLFEPGNAVELAEKIKKLVEMPNLAAEMGKAAQQRAKQFYSLSSMTKSYIELYRRILSV